MPPSMSVAELKLALIRAIDKMPPEQLEDLLKQVKGGKEQKEAVPSQQRPRFGALKGAVLFMAPDFDEPLEDFKDYM